jgi:hypothetical protein
VPGGLVDGNVLLDIATIDPNWSDWSGLALAACAEHTTPIVNPIISAWRVAERHEREAYWKIFG